MAAQKSDGPRGRQRLLQTAVNRKPELLQAALRESGALGRRESVQWFSPLEAEDYVEYRDKAAQRKLGIEEQLSTPLEDFWPPRGAVWDALGRSDLDRPILVEAKAHIPEVASPGTTASPASLKLIRQSLDATRKHLAPRSTADWTGTFYQYANRLAYQYYLRKLNQLDSSLVFVNFTNAADMDGPRSEEEWHGATRLIHAILGVPADLRRFSVFHAFVDARLLADAV